MSYGMSREDRQFFTVIAHDLLKAVVLNRMVYDLVDPDSEGVVDDTHTYYYNPHDGQGYTNPKSIDSWIASKDTFIGYEAGMDRSDDITAAEFIELCIEQLGSNYSIAYRRM